jgi:hypothetical protein
MVAGFRRPPRPGLGIADRIASRGAGPRAEELRAIVDAEVRDLLGAVSRGEF